MKRSLFLGALAAGGFFGTLGAARLRPAGAIARSRRRGRDERALTAIPGRCQASFRENPWGSYHLEHMLG